MNKILLFKIYFGFIVACSILGVHNSYAGVNISIEQLLQQKKVTINIKNAPIKTILYEIQKQVGVSFVFKNSSESNLLSNISLNVKDMSVENALKTLLNDTQFTYNIIGETVTIVRKPTTVANSTQQAVVSFMGKVIDSNNKPVVGATILILGTTNGAISNENGEFSIKARVGEEIEISFSGFKAKIIRLSQGNKNLVIELETDALAVDDVVVSGFFPRKLSGYAGTLTTIKKEELRKVSTGNIFTTISALDAGFKINVNNLEGSNPNVIPDFTIRGKGSFQNGSTAPIFILDGFEVTAQKIFDMDINRIETITLLKDASATILYGSRAANGVIVIETVAPKPGQLRVTYDFKPTIGFVDLNGYDLMNAREKLEYERLAGLYEPESNETSELDRVDKAYYDKYKSVLEGTDTYWLSQPVQTSFSHAHSLFVEGGVDNVRYGIDAAYNGNSGVMKQSGRDRTSIGLSLIYRIKDKVTIRNYLSMDFTNAYESPYGSYSQYGLLNPYEKIYDSRGDLRPVLSDGKQNPMYDATLPSRNFDKTQEFREEFSVEWFIAKGLRFRGQVSFSKNNDNSENYLSPLTSIYILNGTYNPDTGMTEFTPLAKRGELSLSNGESMNLLSNFTLNYNTVFGKKHIFFAGIGGEISEQSGSSNGYTVTGFPDDRFSDPAFAIQFKEGTRASSSENTSRAVGFFANANYIFDDRFFADFSFRYDGSSRFGLDNKFAPFWSVGAGWNIHNENSWFKSELIDLFKLRFSYGVTGNQEFSAYQAKTKLKFNTDRLYNNLITASIMGYGNPELKWQNQYQTNVGLDFGFKQSRFRISANYYHKMTEGMLTSVTVAPSLGFQGDAFTSNLGKIRNEGVELNLNAVLIRNPKKDFEWSFMLQAAHNKNTLLEISRQLKTINEQNNLNKYSPSAVYEEGESMSALKAVKSLGIDPTTGQEVYLKKDGTVTFLWDSNDKILCGDSEPKVFGNFGTNLFYKGWNLNLIFSYQFGADQYNRTLADRVEGSDPAKNADRRVLNDRWKNPGDHALYKNINDFETTYISTRFVQKEQLLQLKSISLSYEFGKELLSKYRINTLRLSFYANDIFRASTIKNERGLNYPFQQSYVFGLNVSF